MKILFKLLRLFILFFCILLIPLKSFAAEVLQISSSSVLQIGDNNRSYKVKIYGINIRPNQEESAIEWLKIKLPRHSKVNLLPQGSENGTLIARVVSLQSGEDIAVSMAKSGLGDQT